MSDLAEPSSTWILTELSATQLGDGTGGYYTYPGYLNDQPPSNMLHWRNGRRHQEGREWLFVDGHVKWYKDPPFETSPGVATAPSVIQAYYTNNKVYTTPD